MERRQLAIFCLSRKQSDKWYVSRETNPLDDLTSAHGNSLYEQVRTRLKSRSRVSVDWRREGGRTMEVGVAGGGDA